MSSIIKLVVICYIAGTLPVYAQRGIKSPVETFRQVTKLSGTVDETVLNSMSGRLFRRRCSLLFRWYPPGDGWKPTPFTKPWKEPLNSARGWNNNGAISKRGN